MNPAPARCFSPAADVGQTLIQATRSAELDAWLTIAWRAGRLDRQVVIGRNQQPYRARAVLASTPGAGGEHRGVVCGLQDLSRTAAAGPFAARLCGQHLP